MKPIATTLFAFICLTSCAGQSTEALFHQHCASCHMDNGQSRAPGLLHLGSMTPKSIVASLGTGKMQAQGALLSKDQKITSHSF